MEVFVISCCTAGQVEVASAYPPDMESVSSANFKAIAEPLMFDSVLRDVKNDVHNELEEMFRDIDQPMPPMKWIADDRLTDARQRYRLVDQTGKEHAWVQVYRVDVNKVL